MPFDLSPSMDRRRFLQWTGLAAAATLTDTSSRAIAQSESAAAVRYPVTKSLSIDWTEVSPDGTPVKAITVNGKLPGDGIRVREGDHVRFVVENRMAKDSSSVHWHGLLVPCPMDGVPGVTSYPIEPRGVAVYEYPIRQSGTYWYHSHTGLQEQRGLSGPFIIEAKNEPLAYDQEYVVFLQDWLHTDPDEIIPNLRKGGMKMDGMKMPVDKKDMKGMDHSKHAGMKMPMDKTDLADVAYPTFLCNGRSPKDPQVFAANVGDRVRLRVINGSASTYFKFKVDGHPIEVTHCDGQPIKPVKADWFLIGTGERYDIIVRLEKSGCFAVRGMAQDGSGTAIGLLCSRDAKPMAEMGMAMWEGEEFAYQDAVAPSETTLPDGPVRVVKLALNGDMMKYVWTINDQIYPKAEPLPIKAGERIRVELSNHTMMYHPMHLHGHFFRLLGVAGEERFAPLKDTLSVAPKQSLAFEFFADNPGRWFFHCHNLYHFEAGMARVFEYQS